MGSDYLAWKIVSASVAGTRHGAQGAECQDAHAVAVLEDGTLIAAVADGAGSACRAAEGAALAIQGSLEYMTAQMNCAPPDGPDLHRLLLLGAVAQARSALARRCTGEEARPQLDDFATTLLITLVSRTWTSVIQVGDGAIVYRDFSNCLRVLSEPPSREYINESPFITSSDYQEHCVYKRLPTENVQAIAMLTDGIEHLALTSSDNSAYAPFFSPLLEFASHPDATSGELEDFLRSDRVCERTDDDKTLILAVRL